MIDLFPNMTLPIMWGIFAVVLFAMNKLVFKPTLEIIEQRHHKTGELNAEAETVAAKAKEILFEYEKKIAEARTQAGLEREVLIADGRKEEAQILASARKKNEAVLDELKSQIDQQKKEAAFKLRQYAQELARQMADRLMEKKVA